MYFYILWPKIICIIIVIDIQCQVLTWLEVSLLIYLSFTISPQLLQSFRSMPFKPFTSSFVPVMLKSKALLKWSWGQDAITQQCRVDPLIANVYLMELLWNAACLKTPKWYLSCHFSSHLSNSNHVSVCTSLRFLTHMLSLFLQIAHQGKLCFIIIIM